ncbi:MAG: NifB/NifX family molybdenum-iron cluster-binding protein [candidate division WOR-3 bacterium]|jgi:predicted Fe-Mo cluster-binding NifX family protein
MKICVTAQGDNLDSGLDPRFGRCQYFLFVDKDTLEFEAVKNPNIDTTGGAGVQSGQFVAGKEAKVVLTGNVGPNAFETLKAAGIDIVTGLSGSVREAIDEYKKGGVEPTQGPSVNSKFGLPGKQTKEVT